jgi:hypothetical protein
MVPALAMVVIAPLLKVMPPNCAVAVVKLG